MAKKILATTQTETPPEDILDERWEGDYQLFCAVYDTTPVKLQQRVPTHERALAHGLAPVDGWVNAKFEGNDIELTAAGDTFIVTLARGYEYRVKTETAGAEVYIDRLDSHR